MIAYMFNGECDNSIKQAFIDSYKMKLRLIVETTSDYKKSGIYLAERADSSKPIVIDWGDGTIEQVNDESISQKVHEYADARTFNVAVDNIKTFMASYSSNWSNISSQNRYTLKEVVSMPHNVASIEDNAFCYCNNLTSIAIPNAVTSIGEDAFSNCSSLTGIVIPDSVISIEKEAFFCLSDIVRHCHS